MTKSYRQTNTEVGDVSSLLRRVAELESDLADLQDAVDSLAASKANISHTHG